jgi:hypothetical protein
MIRASWTALWCTRNEQMGDPGMEQQSDADGIAYSLQCLQHISASTRGHWQVLLCLVFECSGWVGSVRWCTA